MRPREQRGNILPVSQQEHAVLETQLANAPLQPRTLRALARAEEADARVAQHRRRLQQDAMRLHRPKVRNHSDGEISVGDGKRRGICCSELVEMTEVETVSHHFHAIRAATFLLDAHTAHRLGVGAHEVAVVPAPLDVGEYRIGFMHGGELLLGELVSGIAVRMQRLGELAERHLDLPRARLIGDPQCPIEVDAIGGLQ